jgi:hypothetical protein
MRPRFAAAHATLVVIGKMKRQLMNSFILVCICTFLIFCKSGSQDQTDSKPLDKPDQFWVDYSDALKKGDTKYLIEHSLDTIQCGDCEIDTTQESEFYRADFLFTHHLHRFKPTENYGEYSIDKDEGTYRVNYRIRWEQAPEGGYNVIYNFIETPKGFRFQGMFPVP